MTCSGVQERFSEYLDGTVNGREMQSVSQHLGGCAACANEFDRWRRVQQVLTAVGPVKAPAHLGLKLRLAISHEKARREGHWWDSLSVRWDNILRPALVQASAGLAGALVLIGSVVMLVGVVAAPQAVLAHDEPLGAMTAPHYLYTAAPAQPLLTSEDSTIVIEAEVNAQGRVYDYTIVSGPKDKLTENQVRERLMLLQYEPARIFGEAVRGRVLITFAGTSVRG